MRIELRNLTRLLPIQLYNFDLHEEFGFAYCIEAEGETNLFSNGSLVHRWSQVEHPQIYNVRWFNKDAIICDCSGLYVSLISKAGIKKLHTGYPDYILVSKTYLFIGYSLEYSNIGGPAGTLGEGLAAFTHEGDYVAGTKQFLTKAIQPSVYEVSAGYIVNNCMNFIAGDELIFQFNPARMQLSYFPVTLPEPFGIENSIVFAGNEKEACAILYGHTQPIFTVVDLEKQQAEIRDFEPVEKVLRDAGFAIDKLRFRPNSTGRIIATDGNQAALLEISDLL